MAVLNEHEQSHNFYESLEKADEHKFDEIFAQIYRKTFHDIKSIEIFSEDGPGQRAGIDVVITLDNGKEITVDQKVRFLSEYEKRRNIIFDDIGLEFAHIYDNGYIKRGWVNDPVKECDYIAYARLPLKKCYMLPYFQLRKIYEINKNNWIIYDRVSKEFDACSLYDVKRSKNNINGKTWITWSIYIPVPDLLNLLIDSFVVGFDYEDIGQV